VLDNLSARRIGLGRALVRRRRRLPDVGETAGYGYFNGYAWAVGRDLPGARIRVLLQKRTFSVQADAEGWWIFVRPAEPPVAWATSPDSYLRFSRE
jgi:hypothetical protein